MFINENVIKMIERQNLKVSDTTGDDIYCDAGPKKYLSS